MSATEVDLAEVVVTPAPPICELPDGCDRPAGGRFVVDCVCGVRSRLGCNRHLDATLAHFGSTRFPLCGQCGRPLVGYRVVSL